jgi:hypothetical protein
MATRTRVCHEASVAVYHLGNNGTVRELLESWRV